MAEGGTGCFLRSRPTQTIPWFYKNISLQSIPSPSPSMSDPALPFILPRALWHEQPAELPKELQDPCRLRAPVVLAGLGHVGNGHGIQWKQQAGNMDGECPALQR